MNIRYILEAPWKPHPSWLGIVKLIFESRPTCVFASSSHGWRGWHHGRLLVCITSVNKAGGSAQKDVGANSAQRTEIRARFEVYKSPQDGEWRERENSRSDLEAGITIGTFHRSGKLRRCDSFFPLSVCESMGCSKNGWLHAPAEPTQLSRGRNVFVPSTRLAGKGTLCTDSRDVDARMQSRCANAGL